MNALVRIDEGRVWADSRDVAVQFQKRHDHVLRSIDQMLRHNGELAPNFGAKLYPVQTASGATRNVRRFDMDRKGFMLLVMGFSGAKALEIKSRWIDAFDEMEARLKALYLPEAAPENDNEDEEAALQLPPLQDAIRIAGLGDTYRRIYGVQAAKWIMQRYGLPAPEPEMLVAGEGIAGLPLISNVSQWLADCCEIDEAARTSARALFDAYVQWCAEKGNIPESQASFGRVISRHGFPPCKSRTGHIMRRRVRLLA